MKTAGLSTATLMTLALLLGACVSNHTTVLEEYPPRPGDHPVEVWMGRSVPGDVANAVPEAKLGRPPRGVKIIGEIQHAQVTTMGWSSAVRDAKREARRIGGDGIIIEHQSGSAFTRSRLMMLVFRFPAPKAAK